LIYDDCSEKSIQTHPDCKKSLKLEGVGPINAINLYIALGCAELGAFKKGKDASACIGVTLAQHSSGTAENDFLNAVKLRCFLGLVCVLK